MQNTGNNRNFIIAMVLCFLILFAWGPISKLIWPDPPYQESLGWVAGGLGYAGLMQTDPEKAKFARISPINSSLDKQPEPKKDTEPSDYERLVRQSMQGALQTLDQAELIGMYTEGASHLRVVLNSRGASVQQVVLSAFQATTRLGLEAKTATGEKEPLFLIPGVLIPRKLNLRDQDNVPPPVLLPSGPIKPEIAFQLDAPSYVMYHYEAGEKNEDRPVETLGTRKWKVVEKQVGAEHPEQKVVFETELSSPFPMSIQKIYTLKPNEYHVGLKIQIIPKPGAKVVPFRYQLTSAHSLPIEGEWYTNTYRIAMTGFADDRGNGTRAYEDAREVRITEGGERLPRSEKKIIHWTGVAVQYFASTLAVDDTQKNRKFVEFTRSTPQGLPNRVFPFLDDVTTRAITEPLDFTNGPITHQFLLYQGPVKVRLLRQLSASAVIDPALKKDYQEVSDELVDRYIDRLHLDLLTDAPMPNALGRFANSIYWTDIVIAFTNLIHWLLGVLYSFIPNLGICILLVTVIVRGILHPISRKQAINSQIMSQKMAKVSPELKKIKEKYKNDFVKMREETMRLYREHGINPAAMLGGCLTVLAQMPIFMGLYYALQESVFFRLEEFLWMPNLAAPDMFLWWSESIPFISTPNDMGSLFYLGPYFNILPIAAVALMLHQQKKMMPPSEDPQIQSQQKMMKYMLIFMAVMFYKMAAGLCLYFIASTLWGILERRYKPTIPVPGSTDDKAPSGLNGSSKDREEASSSGWRGRLRAWWKNLLEQAEAQRELRRDQSADNPRGNPSEQPRPGFRPDKKKKKKKR